MADMQFTVSVTNMDTDAWADEYGLERALGGADFAQFVGDHIKGWLEQHLESAGYQGVVVEVDEKH